MNTTEHLPTKIKNVWRINACISLACFVAAFIAALIASHIFEWQLLSTIGNVILVIGIAFFIIDMVLVDYRYRFFEYTLTDDSVLVQKGFIFRKLISIPIARIQDVTIEQGPVLQSQNLSKVTMTSASTSHTIDGLEPETAEVLRKQIMKLALEAVENDV
ncbi:PH domain-containing protein [Lentilactobacillus sp. Marseille-Q4993]|uniref:PH domain-containing protein n=1 Tax=Lentilactobacillus sp. Marseille-Q4993 TaxID=3039492 RepID=UPI0024BCADC0|nr:PH domain-containing protein [Lentilactobacillus sp. Marseille-Q4993]